MESDEPQNLKVSETLKEEKTAKNNITEKYQSYHRTEHSSVAVFSYIVALIIFVLGFTMGVFIGNSGGSDSGSAQMLENSSNLMLVVWSLSFILGSFFVVVGKIVDLLNDIKLKR